jgi:hypothetical protein
LGNQIFPVKSIFPEDYSLTQLPPLEHGTPHAKCPGMISIDAFGEAVPSAFRVFMTMELRLVNKRENASQKL